MAEKAFPETDQAGADLTLGSFSSVLGLLFVDRFGMCFRNCLSRSLRNDFGGSPQQAMAAYNNASPLGTARSRSATNP
jgi:hypothetical protein